MGLIYVDNWYGTLSFNGISLSIFDFTKNHLNLFYHWSTKILSWLSNVGEITIGTRVLVRYSRPGQTLTSGWINYPIGHYLTNNDLATRCPRANPSIVIGSPLIKCRSCGHHTHRPIVLCGPTDRNEPSPTKPGDGKQQIDFNHIKTKMSKANQINELQSNLEFITKTLIDFDD